jgi:polyketide cyclase/dehydrase/lipid transport protein
MSADYQIRVKGQLDPRWATVVFAGFTLAHTPDGDTLLTGAVADQAALHGVLARCRDLGITLISINPVTSESNAPADPSPVFNSALSTQHSALSFKESSIMTNPRIYFEATDVINARPEDVYAVLRDYRVGHPAIIPRPPFTDLTVEKGGVGTGTIVHSDMVVWGRKFHYRQEVTEPEPGHILVETSTDQDQGTKFILEPLNNGTQTRLTISSYMPGHSGMYGWLERVMTVPSARGIYQKELRQIDAYMQKQKATAHALA